MVSLMFLLPMVAGGVYAQDENTPATPVRTKPKTLKELIAEEKAQKAAEKKAKEEEKQRQEEEKKRQEDAKARREEAKAKRDAAIEAGEPIPEDVATDERQATRRTELRRVDESEKLHGLAGS